MKKILLLILFPLHCLANPSIQKDYVYGGMSNTVVAENNIVINESIKKPEITTIQNSLTCWDVAAKSYGLDPWLLVAVARVESGLKSNAIGKNKVKGVVKSYDIGLMQINTFWLPTLKKYGITMEHLFNPCVSVHVGAWILAQGINRFGYNLDGIGSYNSPYDQTKRRLYAKKVVIMYKEITNKHKVY